MVKANNTGYETTIANCYAGSWQSGWLLRLEKQVIVEWRCDNPDPCTNCPWTPDAGWYVYDWWYIGQQQWVSY